MRQQDSEKLKKIEMMMARSKARFADDEEPSVEIRNLAVENGNVRGCSGLDTIYYNNNNNNNNIVERDFTQNAITPLTPLTPITDPNTWEGWYALRYGAEMGDAYEPTTEDVLTRAGFDLAPSEMITSDQVLKAAEYVRMSGDRQTTLAMMTPANVNDWVWSVDSSTNKWVCHAKFQ